MENWAYMLAADLDIFEMVILVVLLGLSAIGSAIQKARKQKAEREAQQKAAERRRLEQQQGHDRPVAARPAASAPTPVELAQHQQEQLRRRRQQELAKQRRHAAAIAARERADALAREAARRAAQESEEVPHRVVEDVLPVGAAAAPAPGSVPAGLSILRSGQGLRQAIILHEIFSPPKALRGQDEWSL